VARASILRRKSAGEVVFDTFNVLLMLLFAATILYPFWLTLVLSFMPVDSANTLGLKLWTDEWTTATYRFSLSQYGSVVDAYGNSIFRTVAGTLVILATTLAAAYPLSKRNLPGRTFLTVIILVTMFFSGGFITLWLVVRSIGLLNSRWALILPTMANGFYILIMRNFLMTIDRSYEEAAFLDGANYLQILMRIVVPLSKPVLAVIALWSAVFHWNEWFHALIFVNDEAKVVLQLVIRRMMQLLTADEFYDMLDWADQQGIVLPTNAVQAAVTILTIGPIVLAYPFLQRYFVKGIFIGSLKG
jgi:putative aldouronate transport system permease protein